MQVPSATSLFLYIKDHPCISLDDTTFRRMLKYCRMFSEFERNGHPYRDQITLHMSMMLYYEIFHIYQHSKPLAMSAQTRQESMFREFLFLVSQHYVREREIGYYADQICVTPKYLSSVVRTVSGNSAAWWINHTVIMHAKNLLKTNHQLTIQQISDKLNFPNPSFFGQYFKRRVGMTPFRRHSCGYRRKKRAGRIGFVRLSHSKQHATSPSHSAPSCRRPSPPGGSAPSPTSRRPRSRSRWKRRPTPSSRHRYGRSSSAAC